MTPPHEVAAPPLTGPDTISHPGSTSFRAMLALREFVRGNLALAGALEVADMSEGDFIDLLARTDLSEFRATPPVPAPTPDARPRPRLSVVIPFHNEQENLAALHARLAGVLAGIGTHEIIFVDDGSRDRSAEVVLGLQEADPAVRLVRLSRNFGKEGAVAAGLDTARGEAVVVMDADLQDPPEVLPEMIARWDAGYEVVYAVRRKRKEVFWKRAGYHLFYRIMRVVAEVDMPLDAGDFCLMDRRVVDVVGRLPEKNRFMRGLRSWAGFQQVGVEYERPVRHAGDAKFTFRKLVKTAVDGLLAFTSAPLRAAVYTGFLTAAAGVLFLAVALYHRLFVANTAAGWTSLVAVVLILGGAQLIVTGVLGAYIARIYEETKQRPVYLVDEVHDREEARRG
jgi:glycosyltransferase involved in cell wall biosynthesis